MTQLRHCKCDNSNHFDEVYSGIGHRGSSFSDIDGVTHDGKTQRFLLQEFKREDEPRDSAQHWMLRDLTRTLQKLPEHFTVWIVERRKDGMYGWAEYSQPMRIVTREELRARFRSWWEAVPFVPSQSDAPKPTDLKAERNCDLCGGAIYSGEEWFIQPDSSRVRCGDCNYKGVA